MVFSSIIFLTAFLPLSIVLYYLPFSIHYKNAVLILMSLLFYAFGEPVYVILMISSALYNYVFGRLLGRESSAQGARKLVLIAAVTVNLLMLGVFKYAGFVVGVINDCFKTAIPVPQITLPIGISFYTFQAMSYVIDVYRDRQQCQKSFPSLLLYIAFFPQLIAGPIVKYGDIDAQLKSRGKNGAASPEMIVEGMIRFTKGLAKKVIIANPMGSIADTVYALDPSSCSALLLWFGTIAYAFQIYYDFSGYSDMAIGLAKMFGFTFKENFNHPYCSRSIKEFWRRWHISLSTWFKEYVYIPLGGNRKGRARTWANKLIVFFLTGFWHGANWTFVLWGLFHGLFLIIEDVAGMILAQKNVPDKTGKDGGPDRKSGETDGRSGSNRKPVILSVIGNLYVWVVFLTGWVFFRAEGVGDAFAAIGRMFTAFNADRHSLSVVLRQLTGYNIFTFAVAIVFAFPVSGMVKKFMEKKKVYKPLAAAASLVLLALSILNLASAAYNPFIYFRF